MKLTQHFSSMLNVNVKTNSMRCSKHIRLTLTLTSFLAALTSSGKSSGFPFNTSQLYLEKLDGSSSFSSRISSCGNHNQYSNLSHISALLQIFFTNISDTNITNSLPQNFGICMKKHILSATTVPTKQIVNLKLTLSAGHLIWQTDPWVESYTRVDSRDL